MGSPLASELGLSKKRQSMIRSRMHWRSKPRREPEQQPLELERAIHWLEPDGRPNAEEACC